MKTLLGFGLLIASLTASLPAQADSIRNLPQLSKWVVHHYNCRVAHLPSSGDVQEKFFEISPKALGHGGQDVELKNGSNEIVATANAQMVGLTWMRSGKLITMAQAWVQSSSSKALVLIALDPEDTGAQVHVNCETVTFDQMQATKSNNQVNSK